MKYLQLFALAYLGRTLAFNSDSARRRFDTLRLVSNHAFNVLTSKFTHASLDRASYADKQYQNECVSKRCNQEEMTEIFKSDDSSKLQQRWNLYYKQMTSRSRRIQHFKVRYACFEKVGPRKCNAEGTKRMIKDRCKNKTCVCNQEFWGKSCRRKIVVEHETQKEVARVLTEDDIFGRGSGDGVMSTDDSDSIGTASFIKWHK